MATPEIIARHLLRAGAVLLRPETPFTYASGIRAPLYCDNRLLLGDLQARRAVSAALAAYATGCDLVAGTATAGIAWAAWVAELAALPLVYVRGSAKEHGRGRRIEGQFQAGQRCLLIEDTVSTGESVISAAQALREHGLLVQQVACIFSNGLADARGSFAAADLTLHALVTLAPLLDAATAGGDLSTAARQLIEDWARDPQGWGTHT